MSKFKLGSTYQVFTVSSDFMKKDSGHNKLADLCKKNSIPISVKYEKRPIPAPYLGKGEKIFLTQQFTTPKKLEHSIDLICSDFEIKHIKTKPTGEISGSIIPKTNIWEKTKQSISKLF